MVPILRLTARNAGKRALNARWLFVFLLPTLSGACSVSQQGNEGRPLQKVEIDLDQLDQHGLRGPADGKVAVAYEFAIPNDDRHKAEVGAIDPTVQFMPGSKGRIGAKQGQCLCIGSTHQENYREVLGRISSLPYVERIIECHFE